MRTLLVAALVFVSLSPHTPAILHVGDIAASQTLDEEWLITNDTLLDGGSGTLSLAAPLRIAPHATLTLRNCVLTNVSSETLHMSDATSTLILDNCVLILSADYSFYTGSIRVRGVSELRGPHTWHHTSNYGVFIEKESTLLCSNNCLYYYHPTNKNQRGIRFESKRAMLMLHEAHLRAGTMGLLMTGGTLCIHEQCTAHADNRNPAYGILLGTGKRAKDNMRFVFATPRSRLHISQRHFCDNTCRSWKFWSILGWCAAAGIGISLSTV